MIYSDRYIAELALVNSLDAPQRAQDDFSWALEEVVPVKVTTNFPYLRCVKAIDACPELEVGDLLWGQYAREILPGGYEYVVTHRRDDGIIIKFRVEHLEDCFEIEYVEDEHWV